MAPSLSCSSVYAERLELAMERRALHADELGRARNVAAEPADLRHQIFPLEYLACFAQGQAHEVLAAIASRHRGNHGSDVLRQHVGIDHRFRIASGKYHQALNIVT